MHTNGLLDENLEKELQRISEEREEALKEIKSLTFSFPGRRLAIGKLYAKAAECSRMLKEQESAYEYSTNAISYLSAESKNSEAAVITATCHAFAGYSIRAMGNYPLALVHYNQYLSATNTVKNYDKKYRSSVFLDMLYCYNQIGKYELTLGVAKKLHPGISSNYVAQGSYYTELAIAYFYQHLDCLSSISIENTLISYVNEAIRMAELSEDQDFLKDTQEIMDRILQFIPES